MAEIKLIHREDIDEFFKLSKNLDAEKLDIAIMTAQQNDLEPVIGSALYLDICENISSTANNDLMQGKQYVNNSETIYYRGIRAQLSAYAFARFIRDNEMNHTRSGLKVKISEQSETVDSPQTNQRVRDAFSRAKKYETDTLKYLDQNRTTYPLFERSESKPRNNSFRITRI
jgi:hypothetical protein